MIDSVVCVGKWVFSLDFTLNMLLHNQSVEETDRQTTKKYTESGVRKEVNRGVKEK